MISVREMSPEGAEPFRAAEGGIVATVERGEAGNHRTTTSD